jgi:hypothetical protein
MQSLDPAIHHFRKASQLAHVEHFQSSIAEDFAGAARRDQLDAESGERTCEFDNAGFVGDARRKLSLIMLLSSL